MIFFLRVLLYLQVLLGIARFAGWIHNERLWETHISLGVLIALVALLTLRPRPETPARSLQTAARFAPLLPLATGLAIFSGAAGGRPFTLLHMLLGLATVGLVEAAAARAKRG